MELKIGDRIRELRKGAGRTQEAMAAALGVTPQAVSKWESQSGYPDMETIPALANYFGVTIDSLFGYDGERDLRVREICAEADRMLKDRDTDFDTLIAMLRVAVEEYPANGELLARLGNALYTAGWKKIGGSAYTTADDPYIHADTEKNLANPYWNEARALFERVLDMPVSPPVRENAVIDLLTLYWEIGEQRKIDALVAAQPSVTVSRERLAAKNSAGSWKPLGDGLLAFLRVTADLLSHTASVVTTADEAYHVRVLRAYAAFVETVVPGDNTLEATTFLFDLYFWIAVHMIRGGDLDGALDAMSSMFVYADRQNALLHTGVHAYDAPYLAECEFDTENLYELTDAHIFESMLECVRRTSALDDALSANPRFAAWRAEKENG